MKTFNRLIIIYILLNISNVVAAQFITTWKTDNPGSSDFKQIIIPGTGSNYQINWEELNNSTNSGSVIGSDFTTLILPNSGTYKISIELGAGTFSGFNFNNEGDRLKLISVDQWGEIPWENLKNAFSGCENMRYTATDAPNLQRVYSLESTFQNCFIFNGDIGNWDVSAIKNLRNTFKNATAFNKGINDWDVSKVTHFTGTFYQATSFNQDIGNWDVSSARSMTFMFREAIQFNQDISSWNTKTVVSMYGLFYGASNFNQKIIDWNTSNVTNMNKMFFAAKSFDQDLSLWNVFNVMKMHSTFAYASSFDQTLGSWNIGEVKDMTEMLSNSGMSVSNYNETLKGWASQNVQENVRLGSSSLKYSDTHNYQVLVDRGWSISGDTKIKDIILEKAEFRVTSHDAYIEITWVQMKMNNHDFTIERSIDNTSWETLEVISSSGESRQKKNDYLSIDSSPLEGTSYYRIRWTSESGYKYSKTQEINFGRNDLTISNIKIYPNPGRSIITIESGESLKSLIIYNSLGAEVPFPVKYSSSKKMTLDISSLKPGIYFLFTLNQLSRFGKIE